MYDRNLADERGICLAIKRLVLWNMNNEADYLLLAQEIIKHWNARVVIMFLMNPYPHGVLKALQKLGANDHFIFFASDVWGLTAGEFTGMEDIAQGVFGFDGFVQPLPEFKNYFSTLSIESEKHNSWFVEYLETYQNCSVSAQNGKLPCNETDIFMEHAQLPNAAYFIVDPVYVFAQAAHAVREEHCPGTTGVSLQECITGPRIKEQLNTGHFYGPDGDSITFDSFGSVKGKIAIRKYTNFAKARSNTSLTNHEMVFLGYWDALTMSLHFKFENIEWPDDHVGEGVPESVCSKPCADHYYKIQLELPCCWECRPCRGNEYLLGKYAREK